MNNKFTIVALSFAAGAIIGAAIFWMCCGQCCKTACIAPPAGNDLDSTGILRITNKEAELYKTTYMQKPITVADFRAFTISLQQFNAMKIIADGDRTIHGFRVYMGLDNGKPVRVVFGTGSGDKLPRIFVSSADNCGPCPEICDDQVDVPKE